MRVYVDPIPVTLSKSIHRLADALTRYAPPDVEIARATTPVVGPTDLQDVDLVLCHVIGQEGWDPYLDHFAMKGIRHAVWQHCLHTTRHPNPNDWAAFWGGAAVVASCYDLAGKWTQAQIPPDTMEAAHFRTPNFLRLPLGVDTDVFHPRVAPPEGSGLLPGERFLVGTSGYVDGMEIIGEWAWVAGANSGRHFHLGPHLRLPNAAVKYRNGIPDADLAGYWSFCNYVSGLRRSEGFELPAYEGLACGARPVMFDREDARHWLGPHAEYITEGPDESIRWQLDTLVRGKYRAVTPDEVQWVKETFSWEAMATKFWAAIPR